MIVDINYQAIQQKINQKTDKIKLVVSNEFLKDANYFCREDTGETKRSGIRFSLLTEGSYRDWETDRKSTRLNSSHSAKSRMPSSA